MFAAGVKTQLSRSVGVILPTLGAVAEVLMIGSDPPQVAAERDVSHPRDVGAHARTRADRRSVIDGGQGAITRIRR